MLDSDSFKYMFTKAMVWNDYPVSWKDMTIDYIDVSSPERLEAVLYALNISAYAVHNGNKVIGYTIKTKLGNFSCPDGISEGIFDLSLSGEEIFNLLNTSFMTSMNGFYDVFPMHSSISHCNLNGTTVNYGIYTAVDAGIFGYEHDNVGEALEYLARLTA